jgi:hypothetical protein
MKVKLVLVGLVAVIMCFLIYRYFVNVVVTKNISLITDTTQIELFADTLRIRQQEKPIYSRKFMLKNVGSRTLIIRTVNTSCNCTVAKYDKEPVAQGEKATVLLEYKPNSMGYFSKTADVMCNVSDGFVRLEISGEVVEK